MNDLIKKAIDAGGLAKFYGILAGLMALTVMASIVCRFATATVSTPLDLINRMATGLGITDLSTLDQIGHLLHTRGDALAVASVFVGALSLAWSFGWISKHHVSPTSLAGPQTFWICAAILVQVGNWEIGLQGIGLAGLCLLGLFAMDFLDRRRTSWPRMRATGMLCFGIIMAPLYPVFAVAHVGGGKSSASTHRLKPAPTRTSTAAVPSPEGSPPNFVAQTTYPPRIVFEPPRDLNPEDLYVPSRNESPT